MMDLICLPYPKIDNSLFLEPFRFGYTCCPYSLTLKPLPPVFQFRVILLGRWMSEEHKENVEIIGEI